MAPLAPPAFPLTAVKTPAYVVDRDLLVHNLALLKDVAKEADCRILLAQKAFAMHYFYPLIGQYLAGTAASGLYEAKLGHTCMGGETHVFSPAFRAEEFAEIAAVSDHVVFNSLSQWQKFGPAALAQGCSCGLRINPQCSTQEHSIYDPCAPGSRLSITADQMPEALPAGIVGLHFHTLCEQNADALVKTLAAAEKAFGKYFAGLQWLNLGGGHHITKPGYDLDTLVAAIRRIRQHYGVTVYLEPGEAVALNTGFLVTQVVDLVTDSGVVNAILDASAACHMPDVLEMPYRPPLFSSGKPGEKPHLYRLAGPTCLAGDIIGDYAFDRPLGPGDHLAFGDMAIYSMVKNNTFNGMALPSIYAYEAGTLKLIRSFDYEDFTRRLS